MSQRLDLTSGTLIGPAMPTFEGVAFDPLRNWTFATAQESGTILFQRSEPRSQDRQLVFLDAKGLQHGVAKVSGNYLVLSVAPDASRVALQRHNSQSEKLEKTELRILNLHTTHSRRLGFSSAFPAWSHDGRRLLVMAFRDGGFGLYAKEADGEGERELFKSPDPIFPLAWTADDQAVLFQKRSVESGSDIYQVASDGSGSAKPVLNTKANEEMGQLTRDGHWLAYVSDESGSRQVYVRHFPNQTGGSAWQVSTQGGTNPAWSADGKQIYYITPDSWLAAARVTVGQRGFRAGDPRHLFIARSENHAPAGNSYAPTHDGTGFWVLQAPETSASPLSVILGWRAP